MPARFARLLLAAALLAAAARPAWSCACGCGVFDVQTSGMLPTRPGGIVFLEYDYMDQNKNWSGSRRAPGDDNADKRIQTHFVAAGTRYMFDESWGVMAEVPFWSRRFAAADDSGGIGDFTHSAVGDIRVKGVYSGFSPNMSSGATFGLKLPSGDFTAPDFDRDTQIGTGSTDILLGAYKMGRFAEDGNFAWFGSVQWDEPALIAAGFRPGAEIDMAAGAYYDGWTIGRVSAAPVVQAVASQRWRDQGPAAHADASGYRRLVLSPGLELGTDDWRLNASVGFPVYQYVNGDQLIASTLWKAGVSRRF